MARQIPNLNQLKAFEAAARLGSFRDTGDELNVTHSAVSHQIKALEAYLGAPLFHRESRGVRVTDAALPLLGDVQRALDILADSTAQFKSSGLSGTLRISVAPSFASRWLLKRLVSFQERFPSILLETEIASVRQDLEHAHIDLAIRHGAGEWNGLASEKLFDESLWLVGAAKAARSVKGRDGAIDLAKTKLLTASGRKDEWDMWFEKNAISRTDKVDFITYPTQALVLDGAVSGLGVALADFRLVEEEIREGRLARLTDGQLQTGRGFHLVWRKRSSVDAKRLAFRNWLLDELSKRDMP